MAKDLERETGALDADGSPSQQRGEGGKFDFDVHQLLASLNLGESPQRSEVLSALHERRDALRLLQIDGVSPDEQSVIAETVHQLQALVNANNAWQRDPNGIIAEDVLSIE